MPLPTVRTVSCVVTFNSVTLTDVISARGSVTADGGWPTFSVFVTAKPASGEEGDTITVVAGAGDNVTRATGPLQRFRTSAFPKGLELVGRGTLAYAAEWSPSEDIDFEDVFPSGATDQQIVMDALNRVTRLGSGSYSSGDIDGTGNTLGDFNGPPGTGGGAPEAFDWKAGTTAWSRIQEIDKATLYRTFQTRDGTIRRVQMIGHPNSTEDFELAPEDILDGSTGSRDTERTRNAVIVRGHDYGDGHGPVLGAAYGSFGPYDGSVPAQRFPEEFDSPLIEDGNDEDGNPWGNSGLNADAIAADILPDVLKEFVEASIISWRDDTLGPGLTCLLNCLARLAIGEKMFVVGYGWDVGDNGWTSTFTLTGGGLDQTYTPPDV